MSLEQIIAENTAAVKELTAALAKAYSVPAIKVETTEKVVKEAAKEKDTKKDTSKSESTAETASSPKDATPAASEKTDSAKELSYDDVKVPFLQLANTDKPKAVELLAKHGLKTLIAAKDDAEVLKAVYADLTAKPADEDLA